MRSWLAHFRYFDLYIFGSSILLLILGFIMIYSTTLAQPTNLLGRQIIYAALGFFVLFVLAFFDYRKFRNATGIIYILIVLSLVAVWFLGRSVNGSTRWIDLAVFRLQPAEFAKLVIVVIMAKFLDQSGEKIKDFRYLILSGIYIVIPAVLILIEPDLGSALVIFIIWLGMLLY